MKKVLLTSLTILTFGVANAQLTNLGFETWGAGNPTGWFTLNSIAAGSVTQITSGAPEGSSALAANVVSCPFCSLGSFPDPFPGGAIQQKIYTARPATMSFKWKGVVSTGDTSLIASYLSLASAPVGDARFQINPPVSQATWLTQVVTFTYYNSSTPDSILVGALSDQFVLAYLTSGSSSGSATIGTHIDVDDIVFAGGTVGFDLLETDNSLILAYPNPATSVINFNLLGTDATSLQVFDVTGKTVYTENNILSKHILNVENFNAGSYIIKFFNDKKEYVGLAKANVVK